MTPRAKVITITIKINIETYMVHLRIFISTVLLEVIK